MVQMVDGRLRMESHHRILELVRAQPRHHVGRDENERIADAQLPSPHVRLELCRGQTPIAVWIRQRRQSCATDEVRLGRPNRGHVQLIATHDCDCHSDRPGAVFRATGRQPIPKVDETLVGQPDGFFQAHPDPGRLVVVVLAADRVGHQASRLADASTHGVARDEQVQVSLGAGDRADIRLDDDERVGRVGDAIGIGHDAELHLEPNGHAGLS